MNAIDQAKRAEQAHGPTIEAWRGRIPLAIILYIIAKETDWYRFAVSIDKVIVELSWAQVPAWRAWRMNADPFHTYGALWIACYEFLKDADHWQDLQATKNGKPDLERRAIARWLASGGPDLLYAIQMDYSVGTRAWGHIAHAAISRAEYSKRTRESRGLVAEVLDWAHNTDLSLPRHTENFGRQPWQIILKRIEKHDLWTREAAKVGPLDGPAGGDCPKERPSFVPVFPRELVHVARVCGDTDATSEQHFSAWNDARDYARARAKKEIRRIDRAKYFVSSLLRKEEPREAVERGEP